MGQCGCTEGLDGKRFAGPEGITYVLEIYQGCRDCGTPAGVAVKSFASAGEDTFWFEGLPLAVFRDYQGAESAGAPGSEFVQAIVDPEDVLGKLKEAGSGASVTLDGCQWAFADFLDDIDGDDAIRDGIEKTIVDFDRGVPGPVKEQA